VVVRPAGDEDWPEAEPLLRAFGGVLRGVAARIGAMARSSSDCLLVADAAGDLIGYVWPQDLGAQMPRGAGRSPAAPVPASRTAHPPAPCR
jgi:hypothetical protein